VTALGTNSITLKDHQGTSTTYTTTATTTYFEGSTAGVVGDLAVGEQVSLALTSTTPQTVTKVTICLERVFGSVTAVAGNVITLSSFHSTTITVNVSAPLPTPRVARLHRSPPWLSEHRSVPSALRARPRAALTPVR